MTKQDNSVDYTTAPPLTRETTKFPRVGDRENPTRQALLNVITPSRDSVGATTVSEHSPFARIAGMQPLWFLIFLGLTILAMVLGAVPENMLGGFAITMVIGGLLMWLGNLVPYLREVGLPTILCTFLPAVFVYFGLFPQNGIDVVSLFVPEQGFLDFFVIAVIVGSVLAMPRDLLIQAGPRFIVPLLSALTATFGLLFIIGTVTGFGGLEAVLFIAAPIMAGGLGVGAVPMSEIYAERLGGSSGDFMGDLMSATVLANVICILIAGGYNALGRLKKQPFEGFNGYGNLMRGSSGNKNLSMPKPKQSGKMTALGKGLMITAVLYVTGNLLGQYVETIHPYAWVIIIALALNVFNLFPEDLQEAATSWGDYIQSYLVPALLVGVSIAYISISDVLNALSNPVFIPMVLVTVLIATLASGFTGWLVKLNFVEASISPGLVMADSGGSGDVAVLTAANRIHLIAFAALTNRIGGVLVLFVTSVLAGFL